MTRVHTWNSTVGSCGKNTRVLGSRALSHPAALIAARPRAVRAAKLTTQKDVLSIAIHQKVLRVGHQQPHGNQLRNTSKTWVAAGMHHVNTADVSRAASSLRQWMATERKFSCG